MNVLQRKMFAAGDVANSNLPIIEAGRNVSPPRFSTRDSLYSVTPQISSDQFDIVQDETGQYYGQAGDRVIPIDMAYGRSPREALRNMEKERGILELTNKSIQTAGILALKRPIQGTGSFFGKAFYNPKGSADFIAGPAGTEIAKGSLTGLSKGILSAAGLGGMYVGGSQLADASVTTPDEITKKQTEAVIKNEVPTQTQDQIAEMLNNFDITTKGNTSEEILKNVSAQPSVKISSEGVSTLENTDEVDKAIIEEATEKASLQSKVAGNKNFIRLLRNLSAGLAGAENLAEGFAVGSASAAQERAAEEASLEEREFEMEKLGVESYADIQKEIVKKGLESTKDFKTKQAEYETDLSNATFEYDTSDGVIVALNEAAKLVETGDVTGLIPLFKEYARKTTAFLPGPDPKLTTREIAKNIIEDIINGNIKELTGESGRTISNLDRQVARNLIGAIDWNADQSTVIQKINLALGRARKKKQNSYANYLAARVPFENAGYAIPSQFDILSTQATANRPVVVLNMR